MSTWLDGLPGDDGHGRRRGCGSCDRSARRPARPRRAAVGWSGAAGRLRARRAGERRAVDDAVPLALAGGARESAGGRRRGGARARLRRDGALRPLGRRGTRARGGARLRTRDGAAWVAAVARPCASATGAARDGRLGRRAARRRVRGDAGTAGDDHGGGDGGLAPARRPARPRSATSVTGAGRRAAAAARRRGRRRAAGAAAVSRGVDAGGVGLAAAGLAVGDVAGEAALVARAEGVQRRRRAARRRGGSARRRRAPRTPRVRRLRARKRVDSTDGRLRPRRSPISR